MKGGLSLFAGVLWLRHEDRTNRHADRIAFESRTAAEAVEEPLPPRMQEALGEQVGAAKEGIARAVGRRRAGLLSEMIAEEGEQVCGPKGKHNLDRTGLRVWDRRWEVTLGGRRIDIERTKGSEQQVLLRTYEHFADRDPLARVLVEGCSPNLRRTA